MSVDTLLSAISAAISAGAATGATEAAKKAVAGAYDGLTSLIRRRFGDHSEAAIALNKLEAKPDSVGRKQTLGEELEDADAGSDPELISAARVLLDLVRQLPDGERQVQIAIGQGNALADRGGKATANYYGNASQK